MTTLNTASMSERLRPKVVDLTGRRLLITNFHNTDQETDLSEPPNCNGFGRIRHFRRRGHVGGDWLSNPLPIDPASRALGLGTTDFISAQIFQLAACNWRCWYCFVPFNLLAANQQHAGWLSAEELVELYLNQLAPPPLIDLTGGQPDLAPEWVVWMMNELMRRGLENKVYLWSDDNLSNDYF